MVISFLSATAQDDMYPIQSDKPAKFRVTNIPDESADSMRNDPAYQDLYQNPDYTNSGYDSYSYFNPGYGSMSYGNNYYGYPMYNSWYTPYYSYGMYPYNYYGYSPYWYPYGNYGYTQPYYRGADVNPVRYGRTSGRGRTLYYVQQQHHTSNTNGNGGQLHSTWHSPVHRVSTIKTSMSMRNGYPTGGSVGAGIRFSGNSSGGSRGGSFGGASHSGGGGRGRH